MPLLKQMITPVLWCIHASLSVKSPGIKKTYSSIWNLVSIALATNENNTENNQSTSNILWHKLVLVPDEYKYISGQIGTNYISYMDHEIILVLMGIVTDVYTSSF